MDIDRKLVTLRIIDDILPIENADAIECAVIGGWKVVVKKGSFKAGDAAVYMEIDSFLPEGNPAWQFLVDKQAREFNGVRGHRLRTIRLRGQISQGLILPINELAEVYTAVGDHLDEEDFELDFSSMLGVTKYEAPLPAQLQGKAKGLFPSFIRRTDEPRCQNKVSEIFGYDHVEIEVDVDPALIDPVAIERGRMAIRDGKVYSIRKPEASRDTEYEITLKMDGSSCTFYHLGGKVGVCSRNLELDIGEGNADNSFVRMFYDSGMDKILPQFGNIAIQGELCGPGIQGNREALKDFQFFLFNIQNIDEQRYLNPQERKVMYNQFIQAGANTEKFKHVMIKHEAAKLPDLGLHNIDDLIKFADGPSLVHPVREGWVFKRLDGQFSFKVISNQYLAGLKD